MYGENLKEISRHIFDKYSNIKFHENPSSGSRVVSRGRTDGQTAMMNTAYQFAKIKMCLECART